jgi:hypothetical protein
MRSLPLAASMLLAGCAVAADATFTGYARSPDSGALLYLETHAVADAGTPAETRVVLYRCADGAAFARKELAYAAGRIAPDFQFEDARSGYAEGFRRESAGITVFERAGANADTRRETLSGEPDLVADAGFDEFVRARWDELERGVAADVPFLVPSRLDSVPFRVRKVAEARIDGDTVSVIRLSLAGPLGWFVPDVEVSYRKRDRRLVRYRGLTNIRDAAGRLIEAQIDFPDAGRRGGGVDLALLREQPLVDTCH